MTDAWYHAFLQKISRHFRRKRMADFDRFFPTEQYPRVLDVGGRRSVWDGNREVTILNRGDDLEVPDVIADACNLPYPDQSFPVVYSNSVIEHVSRENLETFASELMRVGRSVYCQTPNRWFPFDIHYHSFLIHWFPKLFSSYFVVRYLTGYGWLVRPSREQASRYMGPIYLLRKMELGRLFPNSEIREEKFLWLTKSLIVIRRSAEATQMDTVQL